MRILVTGSRNWPYKGIINRVLKSYDRPPTEDKITLVSGNCATGADAYCESFANVLGWDIELHPAQWEKYGRSAGHKRNAEMVNLGADICLAFILDKSKGATYTADLAEKAGIETIRIERTVGE